MKKIYYIFCLVCLNTSLASAQPDSSLVKDDRSSRGCDVVITGNFDSECIYDFKDEIIDEYPQLMVACKNSIVTYTAHANAVVDFIWEIYGDVSHTVVGNRVTVNWGNDDWGMVVVTVVNSDGDTCTESCRVKLVDKPVANAATIPAYTVLPSGAKVVYVCKGNSVQFIDQSSAGNSDIAGYQWQSIQATPSSTPNYLIENVSMNDKVSLRVYNNCGCYDDESFFIEMLEGDALELDCYGTVCEDAIVTYHAVNPSCDQYYWYVEGGTIIDGQGTAYPVVQWDHPTEGYGIIGLDGSLCSDIACPSMMSKRIPVIQEHLSIKGQSDVCLGEAVLFSLPLLGSTEYNWSITPTTGVVTEMMNQTNETRLVFNTPGTYQLYCRYRCDFLDCGFYDAIPLTITVKPQFEITGQEQICIANACDLHTTPSVSASWIAYDLANGNQVAATATGTDFTYTFLHPGRYLITAENASFCGPATFVLNVRDMPPAPSLNDLSPRNRHTACPWSGITLAGTPSEPNYSLVWEPACSTATPQLFSGDSVTISYQSEVCDVNVYNYDRILHCQSSDYVVHLMDEFVPTPLNIPANITVCPGSLIVWGDNEIPDQSSDGMLYEWTIESTKQNYASVQGSHFDNGVILVVNNTAAPTPFYVKLSRTFCGGTVDTLIYINVNGSILHTLGISGPDTICVNTGVTYTGSGGDTLSYLWEIEDEQYNGTSTTHTFESEGMKSVVLYECPYTYCTNRAYLNREEISVFVTPPPMIQGLEINYLAGTVSLVPSLSGSYSFDWRFRADVNGVTINLPGTNQTTLLTAGTYFCTVIDTHTMCSRTVSIYFGGHTSGDMCEALHMTGSYDYCSRTLSLSSDHYSFQNVVWNVTGGGYSIEKYGYHNRYADITFDDIGIYTISASTWGNDICYKGKYVHRVDFIPDFEFESACDRIIIHNHSRYALPEKTIYLKVINAISPQVDIIALPASQTAYTYIPSSFSGIRNYTFYLSGYGSDGNTDPCLLGRAAIGSDALPPGTSPVIVSINNPNSPTATCDNTPIELTVSLTSPSYYCNSIRSSSWNFDDGSTYHTDGNSVYHTFGSNIIGYNVTVIATDNLGCTKQLLSPYRITSYNNSIHSGTLTATGAEPCPIVGTRDLIFSPNAPDNHYQWWRLKAPTRVTHANPYQADRSDNYFVYVVNDYYCQKEATLFVKFKNAPTAHIYADKSVFCIGDEIELFGDQGPGLGSTTYSWTVSGPEGFSQTGIASDISFTAHVSGNYSVTLVVTDNSNCTSTDTKTITVNPLPPAPVLSYVSTPPCIGDGPVHLTASGYTGELHWSNGSTGANAYYSTHGLASAYYFNSTIGCPSENGTIRIHKQPDFDALLTGCYFKCKSFFSYNLPVYGLTDDFQKILWDWNLNGNTIASDIGNYTDNPLRLPLQGWGNYHLAVNYNGTFCTVSSPILSIGEKNPCDCDSIQIIYDTEFTIENCHLICNLHVTVCNDSKTTDFCFDECVPDEQLEDNILILGTTVRPISITPMNCDTFSIRFDVVSLTPSAINFTILDKRCSNCEKNFSVNLMPDEFDCQDEMQLSSFIYYDYSSDAAVYTDFAFVMPNSQQPLVFWSEPPMVIDYWTNGMSTLQGLGMMDYATLTQLAAEGEEVCFYVIICEDNSLCKQTYCVSASDILAAWENSRNNISSVDGVGDNKKEFVIQPRCIPTLHPNPTTGEVTIEAEDEIIEILVMDLHGRHIRTISPPKQGSKKIDNRTITFNLSTQSSGTYILRIVSCHDETTTPQASYMKILLR